MSRSIDAAQEDAREVDYGYDRACFAGVFLFGEPLAGSVCPDHALLREAKADSVGLIPIENPFNDLRGERGLENTTVSARMSDSVPDEKSDQSLRTSKLPNALKP